ncbi:MAG TPA: hypothetical protein VEQ17_01115, partial [Steroidobacteraceae bacterium]|nr:hypothetical protein [Steroidobacteraceae bacterium]
MQAMKAALACTLLLPVALFAADAQVESARQCAQQKDSLQRLVCYDRIFQAAEAKPPVAAAAAVAPAASPAAAPAKAAPAAAAPPVVAAGATAAAAPAMGEEALKKPQKEKAASEPKHLEAKVTAARQMRPELFRLSLDNGQVWQQQDVSSLFHVEVGDTVRIEKGSMGSYRMARADGSGW